MGSNVIKNMKKDNSKLKKDKRKLIPKELVEFCAKIADDRQGIDIVQLDMGQFEIAAIADYFLVCTGNSTPHLNALVGNIEKEVKKEFNIRPRAIEGKANSGWIILDFISVVVHVLTQDMRDLYELEDLWNNTPKND